MLFHCLALHRLLSMRQYTSSFCAMDLRWSVDMDKVSHVNVWRAYSIWSSYEQQFHGNFGVHEKHMKYEKTCEMLTFHRLPPIKNLLNNLNISSQFMVIHWQKKTRTKLRSLWTEGQDWGRDWGHEFLLLPHCMPPITDHSFCVHCNTEYTTCVPAPAHTFLSF